MKVCIVGEWCWDFYEKSLDNAFKEVGCSTFSFRLNSEYKHFNYRDKPPVYKNILSKIQYHFKLGPKIYSQNKDLVNYVDKIRPEIIFLYNSQLILPKTLLQIKKAHPHIKIFQYSQDCVFSKGHELTWRHFRACIPLVDCNFTVRVSDLVLFEENKSRCTHLLEQFYDPFLDFPLGLDRVPPQFRCDVVFAGHYEDDVRVEVIEKLVAKGINLKLYGGGWENYVNKKTSLKASEILPAIDREYQQAICGAKVALGFLSKLNRDSYTSRNFQIPAMGVPMVAEYSRDLNRMFTHGKSVFFFKTADEAVDAVLNLLEDSDRRVKMAKNAREELRKIRMSSLDRAKKVLEIYKCLN